MATKLKEKITIEEIDMIGKQIIEQKLNNKPEINIICPRCGQKMTFDEVGSSHSVQCENESCIGYSIRGI